MKQQYRITMWRFDVRESTYSTPEFEGDTVEVCDEKAAQHFRAESNKPENLFEGMSISRIDSPAVAEKTTFLYKNGRQECDPE